MKRKSSPLKQLTYGILLLLLIGGAIVLFLPKRIPVEAFTVNRSDFKEILRTDGNLKSKTKVSVLARASGDLGRVDLRVGDSLIKNDVITSLKWDIVENIRSPISGVVSKVYRESAGPILRGEPIVDLIDPENLEIEAEVLTSDAVRIPKGAQVEIKGISDNTAPLRGQVSNISRAGFKKISALGVEEEKTLVYVEILDSKPQTLGDLFHVELEILISQKPDVLVVPLGALFKQDDVWAVYVIENQRAQLRRLKISARNETSAIVEEGLKEGESIILFPNNEVHEGRRIRATN